MFLIMGNAGFVSSTVCLSTLRRTAQALGNTLVVHMATGCDVAGAPGSVAGLA